MTKIMMVSDIVEDNGKTIKENNMELGHNIPIDSLVEVKISNWYGDGACMKAHARLWVVTHGRDCDGTPLYNLCQYKSEFCECIERNYGKMAVSYFSGYSEDALKVIEVDEDLEYGYGSLKWDEDDEFFPHGEFDRFTSDEMREELKKREQKVLENKKKQEERGW